MSHVERIRLAMPFGPPEVNAYLVRDGAAWTLVDTGMVPCAEMDAALAGKRVTRILITHLHTDHSACAAALRERLQAPVAMHAEDTRLLRRIKSGAAARDLHEALVRGGAPAPAIDRIVASHQRLLDTFPDLTPDEELRDGQRIGELEVIHTPGHAPGHVCLYHRGGNVLLSGDHVLERITPHIGWLPGHDALGGFLRSLHRLQELPDPGILPGHGEPFTGLERWIARARRHHAKRCASIDKHMQAGARTTAALVERMWQGTLRPLDYMLAFTEVLAHLAHMGRIDIRTGESLYDEGLTSR